MYIPKLTHLRFFCAIVEEGSIASAAHRMNCVPSNITMRLQELETDIGQDLFVRERKKLLITPAGRLFYREAKEIVSRAERLLLLWSQPQSRGILKVGALDVAFLTCLAKNVPDFIMAHPDIELNVLQKPSFILEKMLSNEEIDLAITDGPVENTVLEGEFAFSQSLYLVMPEHIKTLSPDSISRSDMYLFNRDCFYRRCAERWLERKNYTPRSILTIESYDLIMACLDTGTGLSCMPESVVAKYRVQGRKINAVKLDDIGLTDVYFVWRKHAKSDIISKFVDYMKMKK
ncbi:hypothetical protein HK13_14070 [Acetobacter indonesiensis]|uniref:LysR family transcriptional regulator n=1 Tax=Acetobacter indonesiensis TaxID=104101 RepID=UPI000A3D073B|nr:LysR family transcriptional regulator [Acetobacter indonesiensis]OUI96129.1 hypothetical protein HK13_14070 [Acetobacter indonesiensis]